MNRSYSKIRHIQEANLRLQKRILTEDEKNTQQPQPNEVKTLVNKVATEGLKNITSQMVSSPQFAGTYSGYVFGGVFNNVKYQWDCNGVEGMSGIRGMVDGEIITETVEGMATSTGKDMSDGKPGSYCVGFYKEGAANSNFVIYTTSAGKPKCLYF